MSDRRNFIKKGAVLSGLMWSPNIITSRERTKRKSTMILESHNIGQGNHKYLLSKNWGIQDTNKFPVHHCHEMVMDKKGRLIMTTTHVKNNILIYNKDGKVLDSWTGDWPAAHGLTISEEGGDEYLYITD